MKKARICGLLVGMGICVAAGVLLWLIAKRNLPSSSQNIISDLFFSIGSVMLVGGLIRLLNDMHTFTSASHSFRVFHQLFREKQKSAEQNMANLIEKKNEPPKLDYPIYLLTAVCLIAISVLFSL